MPKVAVICLCYNQADYVQQALQSVLDQSYKNWELIVVDDASTDNSLWEIEQFKLSNPDIPIQTIFLGENLGNCSAFNKALHLTNSKYVIDLAADDLLLPERLEEGVKNLELHPEVGMNFSNANYIDEKGEILNTHFPIGPFNKAEIPVPEGRVFEEVVKRYFICSPTIMLRTATLKELGGYDEKLAYEDFDLNVRLTYIHKVSYTDKVLVQKRILSNSMSSKQYKLGDKQLASTLAICKKIFNLINTPQQKKALLFRIAFESKQSLLHGRINMFLRFFLLGMKTLIK